MQKALKQFQATGFKLIAASPDTPVNAEKTKKKHLLEFPVLSDPDCAAAQAFGIAFQKTGRNPLPVPAVYLIDAQGKAVFSYVHPNYTKRIPNELLLAAMQSIQNN